MTSWTRREIVGSASALAFATRRGTAGAWADSPFFHGKIIELIVPFTAGGLNDIAARILARWMPQHIVGNPTIVVQNEPSAGGLALANRFAHSTPADGTVIAAIGRALPQFQIIKDPLAHFDALKFLWLGSISSFKNDASLLVLNSDAKARDVTDLKLPGRPTVLGANRIGSTNTTLALIAKKVIGLNVNVVQGFPGANDITLAMERHEVDGQVMDLSYIMSSQRDRWLAHELRPIIQFGRTSRLPALPDVPTARELAATRDDRELIAFAEAPFFMAAPFAAPPGVPPDRAAALKDAFMQTMRDPRFLGDMQKAGIEVSPIDGAAIDRLISAAAATPTSVLARFKRVTGVA